MIAQILFSDEDMICYVGVEGASIARVFSGECRMRTDSGSRICSKIASRSETSTGRSANCDMRTVLLGSGLGVRRGMGSFEILQDSTRHDLSQTSVSVCS
jgi:hypothetical protein